MKVQQPEGNYYDKYNTKNPLAKILMNGFYNSLREMLEDIQFSSLVDAGCGEGEISAFIGRIYPESINIQGFDIGDNIINKARDNHKNIQFHIKSIYDTKYKDNEFDLVICLEVLEHLERPDLALSELRRISSKYILLSVPNEPTWRISNMLRGKYLRDFGNTPGHINHFTIKSFTGLAQGFGSIKRVNKPFPWIMLLLEK